jgi:hypothetical protein
VCVSINSESQSTGRVRFSILLNPLKLVRAPFAMLASLVDECCSEQPRWLEFAHSEPVKPGLVAARQALDLGTADVPEFDIDAV